MKLNDTQKDSLAQVLRHLEQARLLIIQARQGRNKHIITSRLARAHGPVAVLCSRGGLEKIAQQYHVSKLVVISPQGRQDGHKAPQGEVVVWPVEQLQDQRQMRAHQYGLVVIDVRADQLTRAVAAGRNLLRDGGKMIVWHHGEPMPGVLEIEG